MLKKLIAYNWDDLALCGGVVGGFFMLIHLVTGGVMLFLKPDSSLMISGVALPVVAGFMVVIVTFSHISISFIHALRCGQTRKHSLGLMLGLAGFEALFTMALAAVLAWLERLFAPTLWMKLSGAQFLEFGIDGRRIPEPPPGMSTSPEAIDRSLTLLVEDFSIDWWWFPVILVGTIVAGLIIGAVIQRFGGRGGWILWCIWMLGCFGPQLLGSRMVLIQQLLEWLPVAAVIGLVGGLIWSVWSLLHAVVKA